MKKLIRVKKIKKAFSKVGQKKLKVGHKQLERWTVINAGTPERYSWKVPLESLENTLRGIYKGQTTGDSY